MNPDRRFRPLLVVRDLRVNYGHLAALKGISLEVGEGELVCMIGPNGAGKSTMGAAIAGGLRISGGSIRLDAVDLAGRPAEEIASLGVSLVPEGRRIFAALSVAENLRIGARIRGGKVESAQLLETLLEIFPRLGERLHFPAGKLSGGEQQMLAIARALMTHPRLLIVDEPSLGLAPAIVARVYDTLLDLRCKTGLTLLINEQSFQRALKHADRIYVIREGVIRLEETAERLRGSDVLSREYFGFTRHGAEISGQ
jgi:branched-chain amino acid transport system ATP-binding protein